MMGATHALMGVLLAASAAVSPELLFYAAIGGFIGGVFPDLDLAFRHRRTLHFPVYYSAAAVIMLPVLYLAPLPAVAYLAYFLGSAALHSAIDVFGGGLETRPWIPSSEKAVYSHFHGKWFPPKRWIRYDGSPEDLALALALATLCYSFQTGRMQQLVIATAMAGSVYTVLRKKIVAWAPERFL